MNHFRKAGAAGTTSLLLGCLLGTPAGAQSPATAQTAPAEAQHDYAIPAGPLGASLNRIAVASGIVLSVPPALVQGREAPALAGRMGAAEAMRRVLQGSGLAPARTGSGTWTVLPAPAGAAAGPSTGIGTVLAPVTVRAVQDPVATSEGTRSYTAQAISIGKSLATLRETPQSISVVTRARMDDQNVASLGDAMAYVTGVRSYGTSTNVVNLRARGFRLNNYLVDGMPLRGGQGMWGSALLDMALYDRIEVWRGPSGLLEGAGEPSGTINLARKRALAEPSVKLAGTLGSWDRYRAEFDATRALNDEGTLRGRVVALHDERRSFVDVVRQRNHTVYATVEVDFAPGTTLSLGHTWQRGESIAFAGLPLIAGGAAPDYPRSTFTGSRNGWKHDDAHSSFAELQHRLDGGGLWRTTLNEYVTRNTMDRFISNSMVNPATRQFDLEGAWQKSLQINRGFDSYVTQPFEWGGRLQEFTLGANLQVFEGSQIQQRYQTWRQSIDAPDHSLALPERELGAVPRPRTLEYGGYGNLRLRPLDGLTLLAGARLAWWDSKDPTSPQGRQALHARFVPNFGVIVDLDAHWSAYGSFNRIFTPQTERLASGAYLAPRTGRQFELGLKGEFFERQLTAHAAIFRIEDRGRAMDDPADDAFSLAAGTVRSQGFETELSGRLTPQWDLTAGYAFTQTEHRSGDAALVGQSFDSTFPRHQFSLWTRHKAGAWLPGAFVGGGARFASGTYSDYGGVRWTQGGFTVFSLQAGYSWKPGWSATLTVNNLFDKRYFERFAGGSARQTFYGDPRNVVLALRAQF